MVIWEDVLAALEAGEVGPSELARRAGITDAALRLIRRGRVQPRDTTKWALQDALSGLRAERARQGGVGSGTVVAPGVAEAGGVG